MLLDPKIQAHRARLEQVIKDLHELTLRIGHQEMAATVSDLRNRIFEPFMFVIVGEVKAGKSSFVNALLATGREIAKAAPQPMTDTIQQIIYGEEERTVDINPYLKKIFLPVDILREIAIVDTPGTNTIVEHHQEITEQFIPASDLIVFVFEAKNPYRQSAWDFFKYIHGDWRKKVIFVLQQKDLASPTELATNLEGVAEKARKEGIDNPTVFAVSAKAEQENDHASSGFPALREYIAANITGGQAPRLKLDNSVVTAQTISEKIAEGLVTRRAQFIADTQFRADIEATLSEQAAQSNKQVDLMVQNLLLTYDQLTQARLSELREGLSVFGLVKRSVASVFGSTPDAKTWLTGLADELEQDLDTKLKARLNDNVIDLAESIQQMVKVIDLKIRSSETILKNDHEVFSDIAERRENVLRDLQDEFNRFVRKTENFTDEQLIQGHENLAPNLAAGGGMAAIGMIIMAVSTGVVDITGGVLTTIGVLFAGFSTRSKRRKIVDGFEREIATGRTRLAQELEEKLKGYIATLRRRIEGNFTRFDELLTKEEQTLAILEGEHKAIVTALAELRLD